MSQDAETALMLLIIWVWLCSAGFAAGIGTLSGRPGLAAALGVLLGPLGLLAAGLLPRTARNQAEFDAELAAARSKLGEPSRLERMAYRAGRRAGQPSAPGAAPGRKLPRPVTGK